MACMFDFEELDRLDPSGLRATISPIKMKAMAMRFRHKTVGYRFLKRKASTSSHDSALKEQLNPTTAIASDDSLVSIEGTNNLLGLQGILVHPFCIPLVCVPLGMMAPALGWGDTCTFWLNFLALIPLAKILGDATEELAASIQNDTISGLLNATFGNAVEMIVAVQSIRAGLLDVVKATLLGSVLSNILLVLGLSFLVGGLSLSSKKRGRFHSFKGDGDEWKRRLIGLEKEQKFPVKSAMISVAMLLFATMTFVLPTIFDAFPSKDRNHSAHVLQVSRIGAWITMSAYLMYLIFQLLTHSVTLSIEEKMMHRDASHTSSARDMSFQAGSTQARIDEPTEAFANEGGEEECASLDAWCSVLLMAVSTVVTAINSDFLVDAIQHVIQGSSIPVGFIGVILLPIAGNACEHASALRFAMRDRPGLAISIAVGSSTQVALLVVPFAVLAAQLLGQPLDLDFGAMNTAVVTFSILVVMVLLMDGRSNWFQGYILVAMYVFIATLYWYIPPGFGGPGEQE